MDDELPIKPDPLKRAASYIRSLSYYLPADAREAAWKEADEIEHHKAPAGPTMAAWILERRAK